jgi:hypothetical protein
VCRPKHVEQLRNIGIINSTTCVHLVDSFYEIYIKMHGFINVRISDCYSNYVKLRKEGQFHIKLCISLRNDGLYQCLRCVDVDNTVILHHFVHETLVS